MPVKPKAKRNNQPKPRAKKLNPSPQDFLAVAERLVADIATHCWACYGPAAVFVDIDIPVTRGAAQMVVDITTNQICEMSACDNLKPKVSQAYMWRNPVYRAAREAEARARGFTKKDMSFAWDRVKWVNVPPATIFKRVKELVAAAKKENPPK